MCYQKVVNYNQLTTSIQPRYNYLEALHNHCTTRAAR